jgi:hypothetical protein
MFYQISIDDGVGARAHHAGHVTDGVDDAQLLVGQPASRLLLFASRFLRQVQSLKNKRNSFHFCQTIFTNQVQSL